MNRKFLIELVSVIILTIITPIIAIRHVVFQVGFIYQRDSIPPFYLNSSQTAMSYLSFPAIMDNSLIPLLLLLYFNVISPMTFYWIQYILFPFALAVPSMYWASRHFIKKIYNRKIGEETGSNYYKLISISLMTAFLYAITPTAFYFSHWSDYAGFYAFMPALIAGIDYSLDKRNPIFLALFESLTTTDPRGFVFTFFITITFLLLRWKEFKTFFLSIPYYLLINIRTFILLFFNFNQYNSIGQGISEIQLWLNYYTFPLLDSLRGLGLFRPLVPFYVGNTELEYILSFAIIEFSILGYIFTRKNRFSNYFIAFYLFLSLFISSYFVFFNKIITLDISYPVWSYLANTWAYKYLWLFLPTYISEMILCPLFLLFSLVAYNFVYANNKIAPLLIIFVIISQLTFSSPAIITGNYFGWYDPVKIPEPLNQVAQYLLKHSQGNVLAFSISYPLPNEYSPPFPILFNTTKIAKILNTLGVEYVVVPKNSSVAKYFESQDNMSLVFNNTYYLIFKNEDFTYYLTSPIYLIFNYPEGLQEIVNMNITPNVLPSYLLVNGSYVGGYIGNTTADKLVFYAIKNNITPLQFHFKHLEFPSNFTDTINLNVYDASIINTYVNAPIISVSSPSVLHKEVKEGYYYVVISFISYPGSGYFVVGNGTYNLSISASGKVSLNFTYLGKMYFSKSLYLYYVGHNMAYFLNIWLIPTTIKGNYVVKNITTIPYPNSPFGRGIINRHEFDPTMIALTTNSLSFFLVIFFSLLSKRRVKRTT